MNLNELMKINVERAGRWHPEGIDSWSALEWAGAMCGEAGEAANCAKKLKRLDDEIPSINDVDRHLDTRAKANAAVLREVADTIIYGVLLAARVGCDDLESVIRQTFNRKSEEYGFPERIGPTSACR